MDSCQDHRSVNRMFVLKCGGSTLDRLPLAFYEELVSLQREGDVPVIVHGGGPAISGLLQKMDVEPRFVDGLRVTDEATLAVVEMVLAGQTNKQIVRRLQQAGGRAVGVSGMDGGLLHVRKRDAALGFVGEITRVNPELIWHLSALGYIPVIAPLGVDEEGQHYNINADTAAGAIADALGVKRMVVVTDVPGVLRENGNGKEVIPHLNEEEIERLIAQQVITGGMIPKVRAALACLSGAVEEVVIVRGEDAGSVTKAVRGETVGTRIVKGAAKHESLIS
ncbi:acetylglutamate kinase [Bacillaceae bacterium]